MGYTMNQKFYFVFQHFQKCKLPLNYEYWKSQSIPEYWFRNLNIRAIKTNLFRGKIRGFQTAYSIKRKTSSSKTNLECRNNIHSMLGGIWTKGKKLLKSHDAASKNTTDLWNWTQWGIDKLLEFRPSGPSPFLVCLVIELGKSNTGLLHRERVQFPRIRCYSFFKLKLNQIKVLALSYSLVNYQLSAIYISVSINSTQSVNNIDSDFRYWVWTNRKTIDIPWCYIQNNHPP